MRLCRAVAVLGVLCWGVAAWAQTPTPTALPCCQRPNGCFMDGGGGCGGPSVSGAVCVQETIPVGGLCLTPTPTATPPRPPVACGILTLGADSYRTCKIPIPTPYVGNPAPLAITATATDVWMVAEFGGQLFHVSLPLAPQPFIDTIDIPDPSPAVYTTNLFGGGATTIASGESIKMGWDGDVWFNQTGISSPIGTCSGGTQSGQSCCLVAPFNSCTTCAGGGTCVLNTHNATRVMRYRPNGTFDDGMHWRAYNLPFDNFLGIGIYVDAASHRVFASGIHDRGNGTGNPVVSFLPDNWTDAEATPFYNYVGFPATLPKPESAFTVVTVSNPATWAGHFEKDNFGRMWVEGYYQNALYILDGTFTQIADTIPFPSVPPGSFGSRPWEVSYDSSTNTMWGTLEAINIVYALGIDTCALSPEFPVLGPGEAVHSLERISATQTTWFGSWAAPGQNVPGIGHIGRIVGGVVQEAATSDAGISGGCTGVVVDPYGVIWCAAWNDHALMYMQAPLP